MHLRRLQAPTDRAVSARGAGARTTAVTTIRPIATGTTTTTTSTTIVVRVPARD